MKTPYELIIAARYLKARRKTGFISVTTVFTGLGVTIGVAALGIVLSVMNGFENNLEKRILSLSPPIQLGSLAGSVPDATKVRARVMAMPGVRGAALFTVSQALLRSAHGISGVIIRGIEPGNETIARRLARHLVSGNFDSLKSPSDEHTSPDSTGTYGRLVLGRALAERLQAKVGDRLRVIAPVAVPGDPNLHARVGDFTVGGIFESGMSYIDRNVAFADLRASQRFFGRVGKIDGIEIYLDDLALTDSLTQQLRALFRYPYRVHNWKELNQAAASGFAMLKRVYSMVLFALIGVAAFNLVATLIMVAMEKRRDIAILVTMGATTGSVRAIFLLKGLILGLLGTCLGLLLGGAGCWALKHYHFIKIPEEIYGTSTVPVSVSPLQFSAIAVASVALCILASIYPSLQASRQSPIEILRHE